MKSKRIVSVKVYIIQLTLIGFVSLSLSSCDVLNYENNVTYETSLEEIYITSIETAPDNELMPLVFVEGKRYWLGKKVKLSEIENYITEDNYLGSINKTVDSTMLPTEELSANFPFSIGGKLYRVDDNLIVLYAVTYSDYNQTPSYYYCDLYD